MAPHRWDPREREKSILRIPAREEAALQPSHTKMRKKNSAGIPDPNHSSQQMSSKTHFSPHGAVTNAKTALRYLCFLFYSSVRIFRKCLST